MQEQPLEVPLARSEDQQTLFERIGGRDTVHRIVDDFYNRIEADAELRSLFPQDLGPGREKQKLFLEQWLGGAPGYSERFGHPRLRRRHFPFKIEERHAGRWLHHMTSALRASGLADADVAEILAGLGPLAHHMVNATEDVPREPLGNARLT
jgi:hemoglobin